MRVCKMDTLNPLHRWRWDAAGMFGYCSTKKAALRAARHALLHPPSSASSSLGETPG